jgi:hypothetical protein
MKSWHLVLAIVLAFAVGAYVKKAYPTWIAPVPVIGN